MDQVRWQRVDKILLAALELSPAERLSFIEQACADDENLREEVAALLSFDERALDIIDTPAFESAACILAPGRSDLAEGQAVSHYRIVSLLGAGGMGEVYLAEDTRLARNIAIKLLSADFTKDGDRVRRFQQEARAASALNHPNIITIHETGEFQDRHFMATEFIDGETLRQRMRRATLDLGEMLDIAIQVANALAAAHHAGIVHRDIKPENIMLRPDGYVKVLDFGLAKVAEQQPSKGDSSEPVPDDTDTTPGLLLGTVKYMSPEQARGLGLDGRSDIFSLGVVIYEMIAARAPFNGQTNSDLIASILKEEPLPLSNYSAGVPAELQKIVSKALRKEREARYQAVRDMLVDLEALKEKFKLGTKPQRQTESKDRADVTDASSSAARTWGKFNSSASQVGALRTITRAQFLINEIKRHKTGVAFAAIILCIAVAAVFYETNSTLRKRSATPFERIQITNLTTNGPARDAAISPDGKYVAYVVEDGAQQSIWITQLAIDSLAQIVSPVETRLAALTFSRDSSFLFYVKYDSNDRDENALYQVSSLGGASKRILAEVHSPISFAPDGKRFAFFRRYQDRNALFIVNTDGTEETELTSRNLPQRLWDYPCGPAWSPDGKKIACGAFMQRESGHVTTNLIEVRIDDGAERILATGDWRAVAGLSWLTDGSGLLINAFYRYSMGVNQIWHVSYHRGEVRRITNDATDYEGLSLTADSSVVAVTQRLSTDNLWMMPYGDTSQARPLATSGAGVYSGVCLTPDGRMIYARSGKDRSDIWLMSLDGSNQQQLTVNSGINGFPSISPDGRHVIFMSDRSGAASIWRMDIDGRNPKQILTEMDSILPIYSPDGQWVIFQSRDLNKLGWWRMPADGGEPVQILGFGERYVAISPDGKFLAYTYSDAKANPPLGIAIVPFEGGEPLRRFAIPVEGSGDWGPLKWSRDGSVLLYVHTTANTANLWSQPLDGSPPKPVTDFKTDKISWFDLSPDGKQLACIKGLEISDVVLIKNTK